MRFHIDTRSAGNEDQGSTLNFQNRAKASGSFGAGPWGVSAEVENTMGSVSTQRSQSTEMDTDLDLNSSVDLNFRAACDRCDLAFDTPGMGSLGNPEIIQSL